ncbi:MAG: prepilin-type N-terminal cleavage/methylation domain-containing protein [Deltaproteobacteria bacterium]|nr:prepilin-type N-terminal cleavage/methylation domain-containing protein [Deltaproteobacteria bacterium]
MLKRLVMKLANERTLGERAGELRRKIENQQGFTLLEILVVLTIMGFLIAMVAPRLAGISSSAVDTVCDSNQSRMVSMMSGYFEKTNRFPSKLTNLVEEVTATTFQIPAVSDDDPDNGAETLASEFMSRNHFRIHYLNADEAAELKNMGVVKVLNLNAYDAYNDDGTAYKSNYPATDALATTLGVENPNDVDLAATVTKAASMEEVSMAEGVAVAMVGIGVNSTTAATPFVAHDGERGWGEPDWFGRIVLGFGPENGLVSSGIVANAAHCPGGIQNADNVTYNDYNVVLPRLEATAERMLDATVGDVVWDADSDSTTDGVQLAAVAYNEMDAAAYDYTAADQTLKVRTFTITDAQEKWQYATQCPEGHMFPADDEEFWGLDLDHSDTINAD